MSIIARFAIAVAVGLAAAGLNALALTSSAAKRAGYVALNRAVKQGDKVPAAALVQLSVPGDPAVVGKSLVPWKDRGLLVQMQAPRGYAAGDAVFQRDIRDSIRLARRDELEPLRFRVIAVGDRFKRKEAMEADGGGGGRGSYVTIAVKQPANAASRPDDLPEAAAARRAARRMIRVVTQRAAAGKPAAEDQIFGVAVFPRAKPAAATSASAAAGGDSPIEQPGNDEMLLTVPLDGIESVPDVILVGGDIGFFMLPEYP